MTLFYNYYDLLHFSQGLLLAAPHTKKVMSNFFFLVVLAISFIGDWLNAKSDISTVHFICELGTNLSIYTL